MRRYRDKDWLYNIYIIENKTSREVAEECGVAEVTISKTLQRMGIKKGHNNQHKKEVEYINIDCAYCGEVGKKTKEYFNRRRKEGVAVFYCGRDCADNAHSTKMSGEGNPNYGGKWHSQCPSEWTEVKRKEATRRMVETVIREGTFRGENNGRWAGGHQEHNCIICGTMSTFAPHIHRAIERGERNPCCSNTCASALGRRNVKYEATSIEVAMADELDFRGIKNIPQYNLGDKFSLDFLLPEYNIVIECDGDYWHNIPEVKTRDKSKNAYIKACGYSLYRFWEHEINTDVSACVDIVLAEINEHIA